MTLDLRTALPGLMAILFLVVIGLQTSDALKRSGAWTRRQPVAAYADPYAVLDRQLERMSRPAPLDGLRDPFRYAGAPTGPVLRVDSGKPAPVKRVPPILTAIVSDADPRALISYEGRNYSVKTGDLFAEFRVMSVTRDEVVLDGGGEPIVLRRPGKGDEREKGSTP